MSFWMKTIVSMRKGIVVNNRGGVIVLNVEIRNNGYY